MISSSEKSDAGPSGLSSEKGRSIAGWVASGGLLGAVAASTCCVLPLVLVSLGASGAWIGNLTAFQPFQPLFFGITFALLAYGFWLVYRNPTDLAEGAICRTPVSRKVTISALWLATGIALIAVFWGWIAPFAAPILLGR